MTVVISGDSGVVVSGNTNTLSGITVGRGAGSVATNTAVGASALAANTTGDRSTAVGNNAALTNTTGVSLTALGYNAAKTANAKNTAVGAQTMQLTTTGNSNVAVGGGDGSAELPTFYSNTTGSNNTAVGWAGLASNTTGSNNTAVGYGAGSSITTGFNNTFLGYSAGSNAITNAGCIYLGYSTQASSTSVLREVVLGYNTTGKGQDTSYIGTGAAYQGNNSSTWSVTSDGRIKENVTTLENGLQTIMALRPVEFDYIETKKHDISFIAQEFEQVLPNQVTKHAANEFEKELVGEDEVYGINANLAPYLVKAIQELSAKVDAQAAEIAALKGTA